MRSPPRYVLQFALPADFRLSYDGPQPMAGGSLFEAFHSQVTISGPSREAVFDDAAVMFRAVLTMTRSPVSVAARLQTPSGADSWSIILGADVAFSPTSLDPHFPRQVVA
jgi:hypothetical protein